MKIIMTVIFSIALFWSANIFAAVVPHNSCSINWISVKHIAGETAEASFTCDGMIAPIVLKIGVENVVSEMITTAHITFVGVDQGSYAQSSALMTFQMLNIAFQKGHKVAVKDYGDGSSGLSEIKYCKSADVCAW